MKYNFLFAILFVVFSFANVSAQEEPGIYLKNEAALNSEKEDFCALPFENGVMFTSMRKAKFLAPRSGVGGNFYKSIFFAVKDENGDYKNPELTKGDVNIKHHDGVTTFAEGGTKMYFTRNIPRKDIQDKISYKIYSVVKTGEEWGNLFELPINLDTVQTGHPTLSKDGTKLYFSSNRAGGHGGMDLYVATFENDKWGEVVNLGPEINGPGNEIFPFIDGENRLFFSSDSLAGRVGGMDIFAGMMNKDGEWELRGSIGFPFNSTEDDFGYYANDTGTEGFISSNREGGLGFDDIYSWNRVTGDLQADFLVNCGSSSSLEGATISIKPLRFGTTMDSIYNFDKLGNAESLTTDASGKAMYNLHVGSTYSIQIEMDGYSSKDMEISTDEIMKDEEFTIMLERNKVVAKLQGVIVDKDTNLPVSSSVITILDKTSGANVDASLSAGSFSAEIEDNHTYEVTVETEGYKTEMQSLTIDLDDCNPADKLQTFSLEAQESVTLSLDNVYFDFDKSTLRPEGEEALDKLVTFMNEYSSMEVLLKAHTDSRGSDAYNLSLSDRRAKSARDYVVSQGIAATRINGEGFGEKELVNKCSNGVSCTKAEHQANRRVELDVIKFDEKGVIWEN